MICLLVTRLTSARARLFHKLNRYAGGCENNENLPLCQDGLARKKRLPLSLLRKPDQTSSPVHRVDAYLINKSSASKKKQDFKYVIIDFISSTIYNKYD
jgi:hypothetical protein